MKVLCQMLRSNKETCLLYDNGLRIESPLRILTNNKWIRRYVVCQRRCASEAPLLGVFKNDDAREEGNHLELFYLQNYIGYEYGFKFKGINKTLAILVQGQTLIFSFYHAENMFFWKEWLKDVCGRSAMYFMTAYVVPQDPSIIKLTSRDVRIHITRFALVIVQNIPPFQCLYLNLEDLFDVHCVETRFLFRAMAYSWTYPHEFLFIGEQVMELNVKLQCLLKAKQFFIHPISAGSDGSTQPLAKDGKKKGDSIASESASISQGDRRRKFHSAINLAPQSSTKHSHTDAHSFHVGEKSTKSNTEALAPIYNNDVQRTIANQTQSSQIQFAEPNQQIVRPPPNTNPQTHPSHENHSTDLCYENGIRYENYANTKEEGTSPQNNDDPNKSNDSQEKKRIDKMVEQKPDENLESETETEGSYAVPELDTNSSPTEFVTLPVDFMNPPTQSVTDGLVAPPPGLIKPMPVEPFSFKRFGRNLSKYLKKNVSGSYTKYDGDRRTTHEYSDVDESVLSVPQTRIMGHSLRMTPVKLTSSAISPDSFATSVNSSSRINSAIQRGRERMKQSDRRNSNLSTSTASRSVADDSDVSSVNDMRLKSREETHLIPHFIKRAQPSSSNTHMKQQQQPLSADRTSCNSVLTLANTNNARSTNTVFSQKTPLAVSKNTLDQDVEIPDCLVNSSTSLPVASACVISAAHSEENLLDSISVCSELNPRVVFQRGSHLRGSGRSIRSKKGHNGVATSVGLDKDWHSPNNILLFDDYVDIDHLSIHASLLPNPNNLVRKSSFQQTPQYSQFEDSNIDYTSICPMSTKELQRLSHNRGGLPSLRKSNSISTLNQQNPSGYRRRVDTNPANDSDDRPEFSSSAHLTHVVRRTNNNGKISTSTHNIHQK